MIVEAGPFKSTVLEAVPFSSRKQPGTIWFYYMKYAGNYLPD